MSHFIKKKILSDSQFIVAEKEDEVNHHLYNESIFQQKTCIEISSLKLMQKISPYNGNNSVICYATIKSKKDLVKLESHIRIIHIPTVEPILHKILTSFSLPMNSHTQSFLFEYYSDPFELQNLLISLSKAYPNVNEVTIEDIQKLERKNLNVNVFDIFTELLISISVEKKRQTGAVPNKKYSIDNNHNRFRNYLNTLMQQDTAPMLILRTLYNNFYQIFIVKLYMAQGYKIQTILQNEKIPPFLESKILRYIREYSYLTSSKLLEILQILFKTEEQFKLHPNLSNFTLISEMWMEILVAISNTDL